MLERSVIVMESRDDEAQDEKRRESATGATPGFQSTESGDRKRDAYNGVGESADAARMGDPENGDDDERRNHHADVDARHPLARHGKQPCRRPAR